MLSNCYLGVDTSNYTTSLSLVTEDGQVVANIKKLLPVSEGARGLRQSDAVFEHVRNMPELLETLKPYLKDYHPAGIGVSLTPRDAEGSYMPCFLVGKTVAATFECAFSCPVYTFSHQAGHIMAAAYSSGASETLLQSDFVAFHVSGGTTEMLYVKPEKDRFEIECIGGSNDLHAGQVIDRIGVELGLHFPCGPELEKLALSCQEEIPPFHVSVNDTYCNLSGLENLALKVFRDTGNCEICSKYVLAFIGETLSQMTKAARIKYPGIPVLYAGGVMSNGYLKERLSCRKNTYFATPAFSSDNACGAALLARRAALQLQ